MFGRATRRARKPLIRHHATSSYLDEAAQDVASSNTQHAGNRCVGIRQRVRRSQVDPPVRPLRVVVGRPLGHRPLTAALACANSIMP